MVKRITKTNPMLISLIIDLKKKSHENDVQIWKDVAIRLEKPLRNWAEVNLKKINTFVQDNETALVPGKVLSSGDLTKKSSAPSFKEFTAILISFCPVMSITGISLSLLIFLSI